MNEKISRLREQLQQGEITRRDFIRYASLLGLSLGAAEALAACGPEPTSTPTPRFQALIPDTDNIIPRRLVALLMCQRPPLAPRRPSLNPAPRPSLVRKSRGSVPPAASDFGLWRC